MVSLGQELREAREARKISIEEIASATKIVGRYIEALEADRFDVMPGTFFIKGIIRAYAKAVGLNEEETLARYREAGVFEPGQPRRASLLKFELASMTKRETKAAAAPPSRPSPKAVPEPEPPLEEAAILAPGEASVPRAEPGPRIVAESDAGEEKPSFFKRLAGLFSKRGFALGAGGVAIVALAVVLFIVLKPARRPPPTPQKTSSQAPAVAEAAAPQAQQQQPAVEPPPAAEEVWRGVTIEISFQAETWIQVYTDGVLKIDGLFPPGAKAKAEAAQALLIHVGNAGGFTFLLNGKPAKPLGRSGQVITDIKITPENLKDFLQTETTGPPAG